ncbi:MAG: HAMP domain-containing histidine kinase [Oscillospiraceae bacterium]|nr:HAMP domain-containing histidine kinase [Oscillospiraceae bacterium]
MDTKWNAFLYRPWIKALSFLMALLSAAGCVYLFIQTGLALDGNFEDAVAGDFTRTSRFKGEISWIIMDAMGMVTRFISEEAMADGTAFEPERQTRLEWLEKEIVQTVKETNNELRQNYGLDEYVSNPYFTVEDGGIVVDEAFIRQELTERAQQDINEMERGFREEYARAKKHLASVQSLRYAVVDRESGRVCANIETEDYRAAVEAMPWFTWSAGDEASLPAASFHGGYDWWQEESTINVYLGFDEDAAVKAAQPDELARRAIDFRAYQKSRAWSVAAMLTLFALFWLCLAQLVVTAGRRGPGREGEIRLSGLDRIFNLLHWGAGAIAGFLPWMLFVEFGLYNPRLPKALAPLICALLSLPVTLFWLETLLSFSRHVKNRSVVKNTIWYRVWSWLRGGLRHRSMKRGTLWVLLAFLLWNGLTAFAAALIGSANEPSLLILFTIPMLLSGVFAAYVLLLKHLSALDEIREALKQTRQGNLVPALKPERMPLGLAQLAEGILEMQQGMQAAVQKALVGERMKTELITNVSHDLKTPLTSVINYVDLLRMEDISEEERADYLMTLAMKSGQLKRLIEDLVEASKASSGSVELHPVEVNLHELALQAVGENSDALSAQGIELILSSPEEAPVVRADSQKTWRVLENLMSNVRKYTMPGTRVYLQLASENGFGGLTVKNISREPLNLPARELSQRFVRGDAARTGEGSGLGLSIAESLVAVQGGKFELEVDGDLFKASVWLPLA